MIMCMCVTLAFGSGILVGGLIEYLAWRYGPMICSECGGKVTRAKARYRKTIKGDVRIVCEGCDKLLQAVCDSLRKENSNGKG